MFVQNFNKLNAAVHELSCVQRKKTRTKTLQSVATARTVTRNKTQTLLFLFCFLFRVYNTCMKTT